MIRSLSAGGIDWEIVLINDGSSDGTAKIIDELSSGFSQVKSLHHESPMGLGYSIREGVQAATKDAVTWLPADGENDPEEIFKYVSLLDQVDIVVPFVINKEVRSQGRQFLSGMFLFIINLTFWTSFKYTNGNIIYKRKIFDVVSQRSTGFFFQTECLIKAVKAGFTFTEVPIRIRQRLKGSSKAISLKSFRAVVSEYFRLLSDINLK